MTNYLALLAINVVGWMVSVAILGYVAASYYRVAVDFYYDKEDDVQAVDVTVVRR